MPFFESIYFRLMLLSKCSNNSIKTLDSPGKTIFSGSYSGSSLFFIFFIFTEFLFLIDFPVVQPILFQFFLFDEMMIFFFDLIYFFFNLIIKVNLHSQIYNFISVLSTMFEIFSKDTLMYQNLKKVFNKSTTAHSKSKENYPKNNI